MYVLEKEMAELFILKKSSYDAYHHAVKLAKRGGLDECDQSVQELINTKQALGYEVNNLKNKILKSTPKTDNIVKISNSWFGIKYMPVKNDVSLIIDPMKEKDIFILQREGSRAMSLTQIDIDLHLESIIDRDALDMYKDQVKREASEIVSKLGLMSCVDKSIDEDAPVRVSLHSMQRWVQRKLGIKGDKPVDTYVTENHASVSEAILDGFGNSEFMCSGLDGMEFWLDSDNTIYVLGRKGHPTIVTLYEAEFGWDKQANRWLIMNQLDVIKETRNQYESAMDAHSKLTEEVAEENSRLDDEILELEERINHVRAKKQIGLAKIEESSRSVRVAKATHETQFNKIFKRWGE